MKAVRLLLCVVLLASCAEPAPLGVDIGKPDALLVGDLISPFPKIGLLRCAPLPYDSVTQTIGPEGGTIFVASHTFTVPEGALDTAVEITAVAPSDTIRHVRFQPEGLEFHQAADLTLSYSGCSLLGSWLPKRVAYVSDSFLILDYLSSLDDFLNQSVTGKVRHFSEYAVAW